jgi:hypothetical protein
MAIPTENFESPGNKISKVWIYGDDEINGVVRASGDTLHVRAEIQQAGVTPNQVMFNLEQFQNCSTQFGLSYCTYTKLLPSLTGGQSFTIKYDVYTFGTPQFGFYIDNTAPEIKTLTITPMIIGTGNLTINYDARDYYASISTAACSGIKEIKIFENDELKKTISLNTSKCIYANLTAYDPEGTADFEDNSTICLQAVDRFDFESAKKCQTIRVDNKAPEIGQPYIVQNSIRQDFLKSGYQAFEIWTNSSDTDIETALLSSTALGLNNKTGTCSNRICKWTSISKTISNATTAFDSEIILTDSLGNSNTLTSTIPIIKDDVAPVIESVKSNHIDKEGINYLGKEKNIVTATITEETSGITVSNVKADFTPIGMTKISPNECTSSGSTWYCEWNNIEPLTTGTKGIVVTASDNAGNQAKSLTESMTIDTDAPIVHENETIIINQKGLDFYQVGDNLQITVNITDYKSGVDEIKSFLNLSGITTDEINYPTCTSDGNSTYTCVFEAKSILGPEQGVDLKFRIYDIAGNYADYETTIDIREAIEGEADYWRLEVKENMPKEIDRQTTAMATQRMYFKLKLTPKTSSSAQTMLMEITDCGPQSAVQDYMAETPSLMNDARGSTEPWMKITLAQRSIDVDNLKFTCKMSIVSKVGDKISQPEIETFNVTIPLYNMPLGELSDNVYEKIDEVKNSGLVQAEWIRTFEKIFKYIKSTCATIGALSGVLGVLDTAGVLTSWTESSVVLAWIGEIVDAYSTGAHVGTAAIGYIIEWGCAAGECRLWEKIFEKAGFKTSESFWTKALATVMAPGSKASFLGQIGGKYMNEQDSLMLSVLTLCPYGIFYNLQKARNIDCKYIQCLRDEVPQGKPIFVCDYMRAYDWCLYVKGWWWELVPFVGFGRAIYRALQEILKDPISLGLTIPALSCLLIPKLEGKAFCKWFNAITGLINAINYFANFKDSWNLEADYCEEVLKEETSASTANETSGGNQSATI